MSETEKKETGKLGFGLMRLPRGLFSTDIPQTKKMVDMFMAAGFTYFDTAHIYPGSEKATKKALVDRYPRESFTLATKLFAALSPTAKMAKQQFYTSLERTGAGYFDHYLLHSLMGFNYNRYEKLGIWEFAEEQKAKGLIKHIGFSFHDGPELLDELLEKHPDVDFVQLQINYADWENPSVSSRANYEVARKHGKSIVVMEPVKGGKLANPPEKVRELFDSYAPNMSYASWAIRFAASLDGILTVLSGMSDVKQMADNLSYMKDFKPLNDEEREIIRKAREIIGKSSLIPCTGCGYCVEGCPKNIPIPDIFEAMNKRLGNGLIDEAKRDYGNAVKGKGRADECIACGKCEQVCTQHIDIINQLKICSSNFENIN